MDPFRAVPVLDLGKGERITSLEVSATTVFVRGTVKARLQLPSKKSVQTLATLESLALVSALSGKSFMDEITDVDPNLRL
ncbi:hypothetical protein cyc_07342 [Cyclospora cayetanensis]|uniref:Uncharacterized protein n=1 Tax=Cyclospora cayetanensis TaxID=88456 RepID=A0A1D3CU64_9EIME|nr:hypothetical protein cyc_07342 [Cyclospora cayetanensis]